MWLASAKVSAASLKNEPTLQEALNGLVGLTVKGGSGAKYLDLLVLWSQKEQGKYPGVIWSHSVRFLVQFFFSSVEGKSDCRYVSLAIPRGNFFRDLQQSVFIVEFFSILAIYS